MRRLALLVLLLGTACGQTRDLVIPVNHHPTTATLPGGSCHPSAPESARGATPCSVMVQAEASDPDGDPVTYAWSGCASGAAASAACVVSRPGPHQASVVVRDGRGGEATATVTVQGMNQPPHLTIDWDGGWLSCQGRCWDSDPSRPEDPDGDEDATALCRNTEAEALGSCRVQPRCWDGHLELSVYSEGVHAPDGCGITVRISDSWGAVTELRQLR